MSLDHDELLDGEARDRERLMLQLDHEDPLVAYYAKERVQDIAGSSCASDAEWIRCVRRTIPPQQALATTANEGMAVSRIDCC